MKIIGQMPLGTWFALPLPFGGWALGLIARHEPKGRKRTVRIFVYAFGPRVSDTSQFAMPMVRTPQERVYFGRTYDSSLREGRWKIVGCMDEFSKEAWPMPDFRTGAVGGGPDWRRRVYLRPYNDELSRWGPEELKVVDDIDDYPVDGSAGVIAMEWEVENAIAKSEIERGMLVEMSEEKIESLIARARAESNTWDALKHYTLNQALSPRLVAYSDWPNLVSKFVARQFGPDHRYWMAPLAHALSEQLRRTLLAENKMRYVGGIARPPK